MTQSSSFETATSMCLTLGIKCSPLTRHFVTSWATSVQGVRMPKSLPRGAAQHGHSRRFRGRVWKLSCSE